MSSDTQAGVRIVERDAILHVTLAAPESGNRLTEEMGARIDEAIARVGESSRAIVLSADGPDFCVGRGAVTGGQGKLHAPDIRRIIAEPVLALYGRLRQVRVPVIARVRGRAAGVGCALAVCADFVLASDTARFSIPELEIDVPPLLVLTALQGRLLPAHVAYMVLGREEVGGADAVALGLASRVVADDRLEAECDAIVERLTRNSAGPLQAIKRLWTTAAAPTFDQTASRAADLMAVTLAPRYG